MQTPFDTGKIIAELRKKAGYTQQSLAEVLGITDKAISKWERGISCPDISLLPKLSVLLDADIEALLSGVADIYSHKWKGILYIPESSFPLDTLIYDKPLVYYLLSNFLLVGITDILMIMPKNNKCSKYIEEELSMVEINLNVYLYDKEDITHCIIENEKFIKGSNTLLISDSFFLFGASLTRNFQSFMSLQDGIIQIYLNDSIDTPLYFISENKWDSFFKNAKDQTIDFLLKNCIKKYLSRGTIFLPIKNYKQLNDASNFVKFYQEYHNQQVCDLAEILKNRFFS
ncbi:MAG: helix-turn-helix domain-containing protein [Spirochaetaceae bacterium]|nr:helix-turn-helix domain-containing protein [Spirochaetaceae bacterium]